MWRLSPQRALLDRWSRGNQPVWENLRKISRKLEIFGGKLGKLGGKLGRTLLQRNLSGRSLGKTWYISLGKSEKNFKKIRSSWRETWETWQKLKIFRKPAKTLALLGDIETHYNISWLRYRINYGMDELLQTKWILTGVDEFLNNKWTLAAVNNFFTK